MPIASLRKRMLGRLTLRARLLLALLSLLGVVMVVVALVSDVELNGYLVNRLDQQLVAASRLAEHAVDGNDGQPDNDNEAGSGGRHPTPTPSNPLGFLAQPGQSTSTLGAEIVKGKVIHAGVINPNGSHTAISSRDDFVLTSVPPGAGAVTRDVGSLGNYRLLAVTTTHGTLVVGLPLAAIHDTLTELLVIEAVVIAIGLLLAAGAGTAIIRLTLRPLRRVATTATRITELPLERGEVGLGERIPIGAADEHTEVGQVSQALNHMLEHIDGALEVRRASEMRLRRFAADASHELRTPLASIRGYAELTRRSGQPLSADVAYALGRVESEAERMTALVEDLLLLARLDAGRPLARDEVDLTELVVDVVSDAHAVSRDHRWELDLPDDPVLVTGDQPRLHQVLANLLANARIHTPAGTRVQVSVSVSGAQVTLRVDDDGPGIPEDLKAQVFERFARGDSSRSHTTGSTGLGLAIVAAVAAAHGGSVEVSSRPGATSFQVHLRRAEPARSTVSTFTDDAGGSQKPG
jgi:two-component system OmpR family sensor kinase